MNKLVVTLLLATGSACVFDSDVEPEPSHEEALPEDLYEGGWEEVSAQTRADVLRDDLEQLLQAAEDAPEPRRSQHLRRAAILASTLRAELMKTQDGLAEYRALERRVEALAGD